MKLKEEENTEKKLAKEREKTQLESEKLGSKEKSAQTKRLEEGKTLECIEGAVNAQAKGIAENNCGAEGSKDHVAVTKARNLCR